MDVNGCGCCEGAGGAPAPAVSNPRGASALVYRDGRTHNAVLRRMLGELTVRLKALAVRSTDDAGVALLDAWATVADVVAFYNERIANEGFLRTATERRSVLELARAIGYELGPGVAASTYLAFTVETAPGAPTSAVAAAATKVRSIPGQGELPQTFETSREITALVERNELTVRLRREQKISKGITQLYLDGVNTGLRPGDAILVLTKEDASAGKARWDFRILRGVTPLPARVPDAPSSTLVSWDEPLTLNSEHSLRSGENIQPVYAFHLRANLFGYNAPDWRTIPTDLRKNYGDPESKDWPGFEPQLESRELPVIHLDAAYPAVDRDSWLVLSQPGLLRLYRIDQAELSAFANFGITSKTTRVTLDDDADLEKFRVRQTAVYTQTEPLVLADEPVTEPVTGPDVELSRALTVPLPAGTPVVVTGVDAAGKTVTTVASVVAQPHLAIVRLSAALPTPLRRDSVRILANVVHATHGETVADEVLGSGDGAVTYQRFTLRRPDLTHVSAPTPSGVADTLVVRVDGVEWPESPSLFPLGPHDPGYVVRLDNTGHATVIFGEGEHGARPPTGVENVRATYRSGLGPAGNVAAGALSLLQQRPLGIREVSNPKAAAGGIAPEQLADARINAPLKVLTLDRVVSLRDHEDFARAFTGIAKARATALWSGTAFFVHVTVAAPGGAAVDPTKMVDLRTALDTFRDPAHDVVVDNYVPLPFLVGVAVLVDPAYVRDAVVRDVAGALRTAYAFDNRSFGEPVTAAGALTVVQGLAGVVAANLTALHLASAAAGVEEILIAHDAYLDRSGQVHPAELLLVDAGGITVTEMAR